jgi:hypothetical protein
MSNLTKGFAVAYRTHGNKVVVQCRHTHESNCVLDKTDVGFTLTHITNQSSPLNVLQVFEKQSMAKRRREKACRFFEGMGYEITTMKELV